MNTHTHTQNTNTLTHTRNTQARVTSDGSVRLHTRTPAAVVKALQALLQAQATLHSAFEGMPLTAQENEDSSSSSASTEQGTASADPATRITPFLVVPEMVLPKTKKRTPQTEEEADKEGEGVQRTCALLVLPAYGLVRKQAGAGECVFVLRA